MPFPLLSDESMGYLTANNFIQDRRILSVASYSSGSNSSESSIQVPDQLHSYETLIFCDFNPFTASNLFNAYQRAVSEFGEDRVDFEWYMETAISAAKADAYLEEDDWVTALQQLGGNQHLINRLMDPHWKETRLLETAKSWMWFIISSRYEWLQLLDANIKERARKASAKAKQGKLVLSHAHPDPPEPSSSSPSKLSMVPSKGKAAISTEKTAKPVEPYQTFYKGGLLERLQTAEGPGKSILPRLLSSSLGDFDAQIGGLYLSKHRQVAWEYARMSASIIDGRNVLETGILSINIPISLLANSYSVAGNEWRAFVFANRRQDFQTLVRMDYMTEYDWLQGPVCEQATEAVRRMSSSEGLTLMKFGGETAHQIWTGKTRMLLAVQERAQPSITVEKIFPAPPPPKVEVQHKFQFNYILIIINDNVFDPLIRYVAVTPYSSRLSIKTTSSSPHDGDVNIDDKQKLSVRRR